MHPNILALSFISAALSLVPVVWYLQARNIAAVAIGVWLSVINLTYAVDALIWAGDDNTIAPVWCDISTALMVGSRVALPAACLSICVHLERMASFCQSSSQARQRRVIFECFMCCGLPLVYIALHLIVQPRRFDLFYGFGCRPATYPTVAAVVLVMVPPLSLAVATIVYAGIACWHFLVNGVKFYGKRGSISSLTRNLYLRLVGMALLEAVLSVLVVAVAMWGVASSGMGPIGDTTRHLSEVLVWDQGAVTSSVRSVLQIEWSATVVQSIVFFGLFACRMEVLRAGWEQICSVLRSLGRLGPSVILAKATSGQSSRDASVPTFPMTEVDLSLVIQTPGTLTPYGHSIDKSLPSIPTASRAPSLVEGAQEGAVLTVVPTIVTLESPSRASAIASSHNSLESNFDPNWLILSPDAWPKTPTSIPTRPPRHSTSAGYISEEDLGYFCVDAPFPRVKRAMHVRSPTADSYTRPVRNSSERRQGIYVPVIRETKYDCLVRD